MSVACCGAPFWNCSAGARTQACWLPRMCLIRRNFSATAECDSQLGALWAWWVSGLWAPEIVVHTDSVQSTEYATHSEPGTYSSRHFQQLSVSRHGPARHHRNAAGPFFGCQIRGQRCASCALGCMRLRRKIDSAYARPVCRCMAYAARRRRPRRRCNAVCHGQVGKRGPEGKGG